MGAPVPGPVLLYVGGVLSIRGLSMLGKIMPKEAAVMNWLPGGLSLFVGLLQLGRADPASIRAGAFGLLFSFTYLWVAYVNLTAQDGGGHGVASHRPAGCWAAWTLLFAAPARAAFQPNALATTTHRPEPVGGGR